MANSAKSTSPNQILATLILLLNCSVVSPDLHVQLIAGPLEKQVLSKSTLLVGV